MDALQGKRLLEAADIIDINGIAWGKFVSPPEEVLDAACEQVVLSNRSILSLIKENEDANRHCAIGAIGKARGLSDLDMVEIDAKQPLLARADAVLRSPEISSFAQWLVDNDKDAARQWEQIQLVYANSVVGSPPPSPSFDEHAASIVWTFSDRHAQTQPGRVVEALRQAGASASDSTE